MAQEQPTITITIDPDELTAGDLEDMENAKTWTQMYDWLARCAQVDRAALRALKVRELRGVYAQVGEQIKEALDVPKGNGTRSG